MRWTYSPVVMMTIGIMLCYLQVSSQIDNLEQGTFKLYLNGGINTSQISNDSLGGFKKWGLVGGIGSYFMMTDLLSTNIELNYTMRGARGYVIAEDNRTRLYHKYIGADYLEVPIMVNYHDRARASIGAGVCIGALMNSSHSIEWRNVSGPKDIVFKPLDIGLVINANLFFSSHIGLILRMNRSITSATEPIGGYGDFYHTVLSAKGMFMF